MERKNLDESLEVVEEGRTAGLSLTNFVELLCDRNVDEAVKYARELRRTHMKPHCITLGVVDYFEVAKEQDPEGARMVARAFSKSPYYWEECFLGEH